MAADSWYGLTLKVIDRRTRLGRRSTGAPPIITGVPTISGTAEVGQTLTASPASVTGDPAPTRTWQWERDGTPISGATASTYTLVSADAGTDITVVQTETNTAGVDSAESAPTAIPVALILDSLSPQRAYSLRKLRTLATLCLRGRRNTDNAEQDFGFSGNSLDTAALLAWAGSASVFVVTWYDQMGNVDWVQTTQADQPRIVNAGVLETEGGLPVIGFTDNTTQHLTQAPFLYASGAMTVLAVAKSAAAVPRGFIGEFGGGTPNYSFRSGSGAANSLRLTLTNDAGTAVVASSALDGTVWDGVTRSIVIKDTGSVCNSFDNGAIGSTINYTRSGVLTLTRLVVGGLAGNINSLPLRLHEVIIFSSAISNADQNTIALNQGGAYGITVNPI